MSGTVTFNLESFAPGQEELTSLRYAVGEVEMHLYRQSGKPFTRIKTEGTDLDAPWGSGWITPLPHAAGADNQDWFVLSFSRPLTSVRLDCTDYGVDRDELELVACPDPDGAGAPLASSTAIFGADQTIGLGEFQTITVTAPGIRSVLFRGGNVDHGVINQSVLLDNIVVVGDGLRDKVEEAGVSTVVVAIGGSALLVITIVLAFVIIRRYRG